MAKDLIFWIIGIILIVILIFPNLSKNLFKFAVLDDMKSQLKQEYRTKWADNTDSQFTLLNNEEFCPDSSSRTNNVELYQQRINEIKSKGFGVTCFIGGNFYFENEKVIVEGSAGASAGTEAIALQRTQVGQIVTLTFKNIKLKGQEFAVIIAGKSANWMGIDDSFIGSGNPILIFLKPHTLNPTIYDACLDKACFQKVKEIDTKIRGDTLTFSSSESVGTFYIYYVGDKPQFECLVSPEEVLIIERWTSKVCRKDLTFEPTKICQLRPFILRNLDGNEAGETAIYPDPRIKFNAGECFKPLTTNQYIETPYYTYFVSGLNNKCGINQANFKVGDKWVCQDVIKPKEVVVQCKQDSDCYVPSKPQCFGYFLGCQNNKCTYDENIPDSPICKNEVVTRVIEFQELEKRTIVPTIGKVSFSFNQNYQKASFNIGDKTFTATAPKYTCNVPTEADFLYSPSPRSDCWQTMITYDGKQFTLKDTEKISIDPLIVVQYFANAKLTKGEYRRPEDWSNSFIFTLDTEKALTIEGTYGKQALKGSNVPIEFDIINNLPSSDFLVKLQQKNRITQHNLQDKITITHYIKGRNKILESLNTNNFGLNDITISFYYKIKTDIEIPILLGSTTLTYDVMDKLSSITEIVEVEKIGVEKVKLVKGKFKLSNIPIFVWIIIGIIIFLLLIRRRR